MAAGDTPALYVHTHAHTLVRTCLQMYTSVHGCMRGQSYTLLQALPIECQSRVLVQSATIATYCTVLQSVCTCVWVIAVLKYMQIKLLRCAFAFVTCCEAPKCTALRGPASCCPAPLSCPASISPALPRPALPHLTLLHPMQPTMQVAS